MSGVRLPLHVGVDALWRSAGVSALLLPGAVLLAVGAHLAAHEQGGGVLIALGAVALLIGLVLLVYAWFARASDAVLGPEGIRIEGGRHGGIALRWEEIAGTTLRTGDMHTVHTLSLVTRTGQTLVLAEAVDVAEIASLRSLCQTLQAKLGEKPEPMPRRADLACCTRCGAPLLPTDQPVIRCGACDTTNPVAPGVRERVAAQRAADRTIQATSAAIQRLLEQPGAMGASAALIVAGTTSALIWGAVAAAYLTVGAEALDAFAVGVGFLSGWVFTFAFFAFARIALARRRALLVLSTTFGARPPARAGESPGCRQCGAPLPTDSGVLACCVYCGTQSVLGMNVRPLLRRVQEHGGSIEQLLHEQAAERSSWIKLGLGGVVAALIGGFVLMAHISVARDFANDRARCEQGIADACADVGRSYSVGSSVKEDKAAAFRYRGLACDRGHAESCRDQAFQLELGIGVPRDQEQAKNKYEKACQLGFRKACDELKEVGK